MRLEEFCDKLRKKCLGAAIFLSIGMNKEDSNIDYFAGFNCEYCYLIIKPSRTKKAKNKSMLFVPKHELLAAKNNVRRGIKVLSLVKKKNLENILKKELKNINKLGINKSALNVHYYEKLKKITKAKLMGVHNDVAELRAVKTDEEIKNTKKACEYGDRILEMIVKNFKHFKTEAEISAFILNHIRLLGLKPSFEPVVASGSNAAEVHHKANRRKLKKGFLIIDTGVRNRGYCSDITRTFFIGKPKKADIELYELVVATQAAAIKAVNPEAKMEEVDATARTALGKYSKQFIHGIGHSIGIDIHDNIGLKEKEPWILKQGNIITIEPGIYITGKLGIRIEDTVLVTKKGFKRLTNFKKALICL